MNKKNAFTKFLIKEEKQDVFHSSAYAKAQNGGNIGAASVESFEKRQAIDANRRVVRGYKESQVGRNWVNRTPQAMAEPQSQPKIINRPPIKPNFGR